MSARSAPRARGLYARRAAGQCAQREFRVRDDAQFGGEVAADLGDVGIDVNQPRRRDVEGEARIPGARVRFGQPRPDRQDDIRGTAFLVGDRRAPETGHAEQQRVVLANDSLAHQAVRDRQLQRLGERLALCRRPRGQHAAAGVEDRPLGAGERRDDPLSRGVVDRRTGDLRRDLVERVHWQAGGEDVHRHVDQHRARTSGLREVECALHDPRQVASMIDAVDPLAERAIDLELVRVLMEVDLLVRMPAMEIGLHVPGDDHHGNRVERRIGDASGGVGQARAEMGQQDARLARGTRIAVRGMGRDLLVPGAHVADAAASQRIEHRDHRVAGQAEHHFDAEPLQVIGQQIRGVPRVGGDRERFRDDVDGCAHGDDSPRLRRFPSCRTLRTAPVRSAGPPESDGSPR